MRWIVQFLQTPYKVEMTAQFVVITYTTRVAWDGFVFLFLVFSSSCYLLVRQFNNHKYQSWKLWTLRDKKLTPDPVSRMNIGSYLLHPTHHKVLCNLLSICVRLDDAARLCWQLKYTQVGLVALWDAMLDIFALYQFIYFVAQLCTSFALGYLLGRHSLTLQCCPCQCLCLCTCGNAVTAWAWSRLKLSKAL